MSLSEMELRGVKLPEKETCLGDLTAYQVVEKINIFHQRLRRESHLQVAAFAEAYFLNLIALYPVSMCSRYMTDTLKLVAALFYFGSKPAKDYSPTDEDLKAKELFPRNKPSSVHSGYSCEDLALIFDRTRAAIAEAVHQKQEEAKIMLEEAMLRGKSNKTALEELTEEEKKAMVQGKSEEDPQSLPCQNTQSLDEINGRLGQRA
jgi:hypothetical protein